MNSLICNSSLSVPPLHTQVILHPDLDILGGTPGLGMCNLTVAFPACVNSAR